MASGPDREPIRVVAAVVMREDSLLISKRLPSARRGGLWELPGGKVEARESDQEALERELREELGVGVRVGSLFGRVRHAYSDLLIDLLAYRCEIVEGNPRPLHSERVEWAPLSSLASYEFPEADAPLIERLMRL